MIHSLLLSLLLLIPLTTTTEPPTVPLSPAIVPQLTQLDATYKSIISTGTHFVINYSPTCPHCKKLGPQLVLAIDRLLKLQEKNFYVDQFDCLEYMSICM